MNPHSLALGGRARPRRFRAAPVVRWTALAATVFTLASAVGGPPGYRNPKPAAGGLMPYPVITSLNRTQQLTIDWIGFGGPYVVERSTTLRPGSWQPVAPATFDTNLTLPRDAALGFFRVQGAAPAYAGAVVCQQCHPDTHGEWSHTAHAGALATLKQINQHQNQSCLPCHTVGYGTPTGFVNETATPYLAGVQCENCHGPGYDHVADPLNDEKKPILTPVAEVCGGCHNGFHHPTFDEWRTARHAKVTAAVASLIRQSGAPRMLACGPCHSGAVRLTLLENTEAPADSQAPLPDNDEAASVPITCVVCHDPHVKLGQEPQLRNPTKSLKPYSYSTAADRTFAGQYDASINLCGQCHNLRGARWQDTSRYPHYSPQYNVLIGSGGVEDGTPPQAPHRDAQKQCAGCHTHPHEVANPNPANPVYTGHDFQVTLRACAPCHSEKDAAYLKSNIQSFTQKTLQSLKQQLDTWATTKADATLRAKYGALTWEYNTPGHLSNPTEDPNVRGPTTAEQAAVPDGIKQARFNLYLVYQDSSLGVHNFWYSRYLLEVAAGKVKAELAQ